MTPAGARGEAPLRLHHVQVSCPPGGEELARRFWAEGLGLVEVEEPQALRSRGGAWFRSHDADGAIVAEIHVGVEEPFVPARRAHPALLLADPAALEETGARLETLGFEVDHRERHTFAGYERLHVRDGHGNRVELLAEAAARH
ncbi:MULTISPECIES: VOC family protein [unclassified Nocardioides]|uniref:VOC family protein n=1 Tax=unclassified Nocardioides TaxID=2615069 RepID=UPI001E590524|nr:MULTISPECIES: VOC family protein [unclassified Nocardioides]